MRTGGDLGIICHHTKPEISAPQLTSQPMQICHQNLRCRFSLLIEPVTYLRLAHGWNIAVDHRRNLHRGAGHDHAAGLHSARWHIIAKGLGKLPQQFLIRSGDAL